MKYSLNGTVVNLKDQVCQLNDCIPGHVRPQANLYIRIGNKCNAACKFCEYHGENDSFDFQIFQKAVSLFKQHDIMGKIQITGGEPTLYEDRLIQVIPYLRENFTDTFIGINSNGSNLETLLKLSDYVDNFAISRHHYDDDINRSIFNQPMIADSKKLKAFIELAGEHKVHLSCNLMKSGINNIDEVKKYLEFVASIGCYDVGFVSLMSINEFCKGEQVLFDNLGIESDEEFLNYATYRKKNNICRCANYMYTSKTTCKVVDIYGRYVCKPQENQGLLVFSNNKLTDGFTGPEIKLD